MNENVARLFDPPKLTGKHLTEVLSSGWLTTGPMCQRLKIRLGEWHGWNPEKIVLCSSATAAFQAIIDLLDARYGVHNFDIAITDATWPGLHQAIERSGFVRHTQSYFVRNKHKGPWVQVLTDIGGASLIDEKEWPDATVKIHDCCHSWVPMRTVDFAFASFYPTKLVPGAEGGVVFCRTKDEARELEQWAYCGLVPGAAGSGTVPKVNGRKANMTDVQAALNLEAVDLFREYAEGLMESYSEYSRQATNAGFPYRRQTFRPYLFQLEIPADRVSEFRERLQHWGVSSAWNFRPAGLVTLPMYPHMSKFAQSLVIGVVDRVWKEVKLVRGSRPPAPIPMPE